MNKGFVGFVIAISLLVVIAMMLGNSDPITPAIVEARSETSVGVTTMNVFNQGLAFLAKLLAGAAIVFQTFLPPVVGLANNGDFPKIIGQFDVGNPSADPDVFRFADVRHVIDPKYHYESRFYSSELVLFAAALGLNSVSFDPDILDMRVLGAVHAGVFLLAFYRLLPLVRSFRPVLRWGVLLLILVAFTDVMYVSYFNSKNRDSKAAVSM